MSLGAMVIAAVRLLPPHLVMAGGHPDFSYYALSFRHGTYSDLVALYGSRRLYLHHWPYVHTVIEYPVVIGFFMAAMARLPGFLAYYWGSVAGTMVALVASLYALRSGRGPQSWWFAASPLILLFGLVNWDLLGIATWGMAVLAYERGYWRVSGLWLGVGIATKFFPIVLFPYLAYGLWRQTSPGQRVPFRQFVWGCALSAVGLNAPVALAGWRGWAEFFTFNSGRAPDPGVWGVLTRAHLLTIVDVNVLSLVATGLGGMVLLLAVRRRLVSPVGAAANALAWWLLCNKVYSPQYILWAYYAALWREEVNPLQLVLMNIVGLFDFGLAMRWLALGTTGSPFLSAFTARVPIPVIACRDSALLWCAGRVRWPVRLHNRFQARQV